MLLTENEAKTKWCPMARVDWEETIKGKKNSHSTFNRRQIADEDDAELACEQSVTNCVGSSCMMWRETFKLSPPKAESYESGAGGHEVVSTKVGYCGLAGKPFGG